ncbi:MAG: nucleotidyltransferase [Deltaproteobacteria bacterium]|nr:nucleotidyltransferase [Deltaproteobacteria bacterium]
MTNESSGSRPRPPSPRAVEPFDPGPSVAAAVRALEADGSRFVLIGGLALEAWGVGRSTKDVDFAVLVGAAESAAGHFDAAFRKPLRIGGVGIRDPERAIKIDFIDRRFYFRDLYRELMEEASAANRSVSVSGIEVPLVSLEYLLATKLVSGEPKDDFDVRRLLGLAGLDYRHAHALVLKHLGAATASRLEVMARDVGRPEVTKRKLYETTDDSIPESEG